MTFIILLFLSIRVAMSAAAATESYKNQYCTDPRTMKKHSAYTEWADAYSCTRHRCQPGGRNLAIYTVGCKRVEAPESAIECEEVVEDTNMQFPYCCTRLRCLVVVRGEVWTKVLGQPWESLPAAPWSHMYKMKRPPPSDNFLPMSAVDGPVYTIAEPEHERPGQGARAMSAPRLPGHKSPDIVIALNTGNEKNEDLKKEEPNQRVHKNIQPELFFEDDGLDFRNEDQEEPLLPDKEIIFRPSELLASSEKKEKPKNLQALVDAIGSRMRDIEHVVKKMSEKVHHPKPLENDFSPERQGPPEPETPWRRALVDTGYESGSGRTRRPHHGDQVSRTAGGDVTASKDTGYFSDASNIIFRKDPPMEPALTYMAPIDNSIKDLHMHTAPKVDKSRKKQIRKKKKSKGGKSHKKHRVKDAKKKKEFSTAELKNLLSLEDGEPILNK